MLAGMKALALFLLLFLAFPALAHDHDREESHDRARRAVEAGEVVPLQAILAAVARDYPGDVIETELEQFHGRPAYEIKLLSPEGRVMQLIYDAHDGSLLKVKGKRP